MRYNVEIDAEHAEKFKHWFRDRGGVLVWENKEIGGSAPREVFTPAWTEDGQPYQPPNWRYLGAGEPIDYNSTRVRESEVLQNFNGRMKKFYWGMGLHPQTEAKAKRMRDTWDFNSPSERVEYRWQPGWNGLCLVEIVKVTKTFLSEYVAPVVQ